MSSKHIDRENARIVLENASFAHSISYLYLTFNSITTIYRACINNDLSMAVFIVFVYLGYCVLDFCITTYNQLPCNGTSRKKEFLKVTIWSLTSAILFGFGYQFSTFMSMVAVVPMYAIATVSSLFLFYIYFIYDNDDQNSGCEVCCDVEGIQILHFSCSKNGDKNTELYGVDPLENV